MLLETIAEHFFLQTFMVLSKLSKQFEQLITIRFNKNNESSDLKALYPHPV
jgi:hypothetical protein